MNQTILISSFIFSSFFVGFFITIVVTIKIFKKEKQIMMEIQKTETNYNVILT